MFGVGFIGLACALAAALSRNPFAAAGLLTLGFFLAVLLVVAGLKSPRQSAPIARQVAAMLDRALMTIGLVTIVAVGVGVAAAVCLLCFFVVCALSGPAL